MASSPPIRAERFLKSASCSLRPPTSRHPCRYHEAQLFQPLCGYVGQSWSHPELTKLCTLAAVQGACLGLITGHAGPEPGLHQLPSFQPPASSPDSSPCSTRTPRADAPLQHALLTMADANDEPAQGRPCFCIRHPSRSPPAGYAQHTGLLHVQVSICQSTRLRCEVWASSPEAGDAVREQPQAAWRPLP